MPDHKSSTITLITLFTLNPITRFTHNLTFTSSLPSSRSSPGSHSHSHTLAHILSLTFSLPHTHSHPHHHALSSVVGVKTVSLRVEDVSTIPVPVHRLGHCRSRRTAACPPGSRLSTWQARSVSRKRRYACANMCLLMRDVRVWRKNSRMRGVRAARVEDARVSSHSPDRSVCSSRRAQLGQRPSTSTAASPSSNRSVPERAPRTFLACILLCTHTQCTCTRTRQVVIALGDEHRDHVPYRQCKLTHVLRDSLGTVL